MVLNNLIDQLSNQTTEGMTDAQKQNRLNLIGSLVAGITAAAGGEAAVAANAAQIESANNHLNVYEKIQLRNERSQYQASCGGENAATDSCRGLKNSIETLEEKGRSVLASETSTPGEDFAPAQTIKIEPNDVIQCVGSSNGYCVVTDESVSPEGKKEWVLKPASEEQALEGKARNAQVLANINDSVKKAGGALFEAGCGTDALCMIYRIGGGANPVDGKVPSAGDRLLTGIELFVMAAGARSSFKGAPADAPRVSNGVALDPRLPDPSAGLGYTPAKLVSSNPNVANSHTNGYTSELKLANNVAALPNQTVVRYGDALGTHGADVVSVNVARGDVYLWDSKFRSSISSIPSSPTFAEGSRRLANAIAEARFAITRSSLAPEIKQKALLNLQQGNFTANTVGAGAAKNSTVVKFCGGKPC